MERGLCRTLLPRGMKVAEGRSRGETSPRQQTASACRGRSRPSPPLPSGARGGGLGYAALAVVSLSLAAPLLGQEVVNRGGMLYRRDVVPTRVPVTSVETLPHTETTFRVAERTTTVDQIRPRWQASQQVVPKTQLYVPNRPGYPVIAVPQNVPVTTYQVQYDKVQVPVTLRELVPETRTVERPTRVLAWKESTEERLTYLGPAPGDGSRYASNGPIPPAANIPGDRATGSMGAYQPPPGAFPPGGVVSRGPEAASAVRPTPAHPGYVGGVMNYDGDDPPRLGPALAR